MKGKDDVKRKSTKEGPHSTLNLLIMIGCVLIIVFSVVTWILFYKFEVCDNWKCFNDNLKKCKRAKFIGGTDNVYEYKILSREGNKCEVKITLLQGDLNTKDSNLLEGSSMVCYLPVSVVMIPESNLDLCNGLLKEGLQDIIINKLHTYIVQNLGKINIEILGLEEIEV